MIKNKCKKKNNKVFLPTENCSKYARYPLHSAPISVRTFIFGYSL